MTKDNFCRGELSNCLTVLKKSCSSLYDKLNKCTEELEETKEMVNSLKTQLEEAKENEETLKSQLIEKEESCHTLELEVINLKRIQLENKEEIKRLKT
jgi:archaellum component FlaC